jgi:ubiquinone/menaquinone biosynthesis C-methylase UbiE
MSHSDPEQSKQAYVPAAGHDLFLPLYDPILRLLAREGTFRNRLLDLVDLRPGHRLLDVGCGTGTFALLAKRRCPEAVVTGVDGDGKVLAVARAKLAKAGVAVQLDESLADRLPYADRTFDRVTSSLVLHHLTREDKLAALREIQRVLLPGGAFLLADFGRPVGLWARAAAAIVQRGERLRDNLLGRLPELMREAGFERVTEQGHHATAFGTVAFYAGLST